MNRSANTMVQKVSLPLQAAGIATLVAAVVTETYWLMALPFAAVALWLLLRDLRITFLLLLASLPLSKEVEFSAYLATDFPDEALMLLVTGSLLAIFLYRPQLFPQAARKSSLFLLLLMQLGWMSFTIIYSYEPLLSIKYVLAKTWYIAPFVLGTLIFLREQKDFALAGKVMVLSMLLPVGYSLFHHAQSGFSFESVNASFGPFFRNHVNYSAMLVCLLPLAVVFYLQARDKAKRFWLAVLLVYGFALFFAYSRGAWLCVFSGGITWVAVKRKFLLSLLLASVLLIAAVFGWLVHNNNYLRFAPDFTRTIYHSDFTAHMEATYALKDVSTVERFYRWIAGVRMVVQEPVTGFGPNSFYHQYRRFAIPVFETWVSNNPERSTVHNYFLLLAIEQGIPGLLLFLLILWLMYSIALRAYHQLADPFHRTMAMLAAVILSMLVTLNMLSDLIETDKVGSIFFLVAGVLIYLQHQLNTQLEIPND